MKRVNEILKRLFPLDAILCTALVFAVMYGVAGLFERIKFLNPLDMALSDFEMMDMVYATNMKDDLDLPKVDTNIVLINLGVNRNLIARQLDFIASQKPKAVAIDAGFLFEKEDKPYDDSLLEAAMAKTPNLVLYAMLRAKDTSIYGGFDSLELCHPRFAQHGTPAYVNMRTEGFGKEAFRICRSFWTNETVNGKRIFPLSMQMAWFADSNKVKQFLARGNQLELINYTGNWEKFMSLDVGEVLPRDEDGFSVDPVLNISLKDKLVFLGYMGPYLDPEAQQRTIEDKFYTPLNEKFAGKAYPDMFGVVVHANITNMVLQNKPIDVLSENGSLLLAVLLCYLNVLGFFFIHRNYQTWYDLSVKAIQIFEVGLILWVALRIFSGFDYKADLTLAAFAVGLSGDVLEVYVGLKEKLIRPLFWLKEKLAGIFIRRAKG